MPYRKNRKPKQRKSSKSAKRPTKLLKGTLAEAIKQYSSPSSRISSLTGIETFIEQVTKHYYPNVNIDFPKVPVGLGTAVPHLLHLFSLTKKIVGGGQTELPASLPEGFKKSLVWLLQYLVKTVNHQDRLQTQTLVTAELFFQDAATSMSIISIHFYTLQHLRFALQWEDQQLFAQFRKTKPSMAADTPYKQQSRLAHLINTYEDLYAYSSVIFGQLPRLPATFPSAFRMNKLQESQLEYIKHAIAIRNRLSNLRLLKLEQLQLGSSQEVSSMDDFVSLIGTLLKTDLKVMPRWVDEGCKLVADQKSPYAEAVTYMIRSNYYEANLSLLFAIDILVNYLSQRVQDDCLALSSADSTTKLPLPSEAKRKSLEKSLLEAITICNMALRTKTIIPASYSLTTPNFQKSFKILLSQKTSVIRRISLLRSRLEVSLETLRAKAKPPMKAGKQTATTKSTRIGAKYPEQFFQPLTASKANVSQKQPIVTTTATESALPETDPASAVPIIKSSANGEPNLYVKNGINYPIKKLEKHYGKRASEVFYACVLIDDKEIFNEAWAKLGHYEERLWYHKVEHMDVEQQLNASRQNKLYSYKIRLNSSDRLFGREYSVLENGKQVPFILFNDCRRHKKQYLYILSGFRNLPAAQDISDKVLSPKPPISLATIPGL